MWTLLLLLSLQDDAALKSAVSRALPLLQKSGAEYPEHRSCFGCHHQTFPVLALTTARSRGFAIDEKLFAEQIDFTAKSLARGAADYKKGKGQGGHVDTASSGLWTLEMGGYQADDTTAAVAGFLIQFQRDQEHWTPASRRPPMEQSPYTSTAMTLRALKAYATPEQKADLERRVEVVKKWLMNTRPVETEDRASRIRALHEIGADTAEAARDLIEMQRGDGGWAQLKTMESDAYATGTVLVALHGAGALKTGDDAYKKGVKFLLSTQKDDGSWLVKSRSKPIQSYFESGFPHGKDQFISIAATSWATTALALACPR